MSADGPPAWGADSACDGAEPFALRVLGQDMTPEFQHGDIVVIEPGGAVKDGSFVLAWHAGAWTLRQLRRLEAGWALRALNPADGEPADHPLPDLGAVRGVVIQKAVPGRRRLSKSYL